MQETKIQRKDLRDDMVLVSGWDCYFSLPKYKKGVSCLSCLHLPVSFLLCLHLPVSSLSCLPSTRSPTRCRLTSTGYSGVAIYTRQSVCAPIRAEEGVTGVLHPPNSILAYRDLPKDQRIGGYPIQDQLNQSVIDPATLDSEGRCVLLEFPAFVLIGTYCPANRDESRDDYRLGFLNALDARVRNLAREGKRVILTGDLNISREEIDTANAEEQMRKHGLTGSEFVSTPSRRLFNQLLVDGKVFGERDEGREEPVLWDLCRGYHPSRKGMFTCWEQRINARPGNFGSRIDYVLCSVEIKDWFCDANIQEGLLVGLTQCGRSDDAANVLQGSDHCPVYASIKDRVRWDDKDVDIKDIMNPPGTFREGKRLRQYSTKDIPPLSGKLIPEFDRRRNIRDMFTKKPSLSCQNTDPAVVDTATLGPSFDEKIVNSFAPLPPTPITPIDVRPTPATSFESASASAASRRRSESASFAESAASASEQDGAGSSSNNKVTDATGRKRGIDDLYSTRPLKRSKSGTAAVAATASATATTNNGLKKGQQSLKGFFTAKHPADANGGGGSGAKGNGSSSSSNIPKATTTTSTTIIEGASPIAQRPPQTPPTASPKKSIAASLSQQPQQQQSPSIDLSQKTPTTNNIDPDNINNVSQDDESIIDPIVSKESWSRLFTKKAPPRCEGHNEPCLSLTTKKNGMNCGRAFWMCAR